MPPYFFLISLFSIFSLTLAPLESNLFVHSGHIKKSKKNYSAFDEDKILFQWLEQIPEIKHFYVDIGANDGITKSNTAKLAFNNWWGVCFELDEDLCKKFTKSYRGLSRIKLSRSKVTPNNVLDLLERYGTPKNFGVLSLDIDSYDYFVLEVLLTSYRPTIIIAEINEKIPPPLLFTVLYSENYAWDNSHFFGQSISLLETLANKHQYAILCLDYNNAFLVDRQLYDGPSLSAEEAYNNGYRDRLDRHEKFSYNSDMESLLSLPTQEALDFLKQRFSNHTGEYSLYTINH